MESPNLVDLQIHQQIAHLKPRVKKLEELSHVFDKTIDGLIAKQQMYVERLGQLADGMEKVIDRLTRIEMQNEREEGKRQLLGKIFGSKLAQAILFSIPVSIMMLLFSPQNKDSIIIAFINKVLS